MQLGLALPALHVSTTKEVLTRASLSLEVGLVGCVLHWRAAGAPCGLTASCTHTWWTPTKMCRWCLLGVPA